MDPRISNMRYHQERGANAAARIDAAMAHERTRRHLSMLQAIASFDKSTQSVAFRLEDLARLEDRGLRLAIEEFLQPILARG